MASPNATPWTGGNRPVQRTRTKMTAAGLLSLALVAAACGGDDSDDASSATTAGGAATSAPLDHGRRRRHGDDRRRPSADLAGRVGGALDQGARRDRQADQGQQVGQVGRRQDADRPRGLDGRPDQVRGRLVGHRGRERHDDQDRPVDRRCRAPTPTTATSAKAIDFLFDYYNDQGLFKDTTKNVTRKVQYIDEGRRLRRGPDDPERRRVPGLRQGLRHLDARLAGDAEDLRQDQPALRAPAVRDDRPPGLG